MNKESFLHYRTGIDAVDDQHWKLIEDVSQIKNLLKSNDVDRALSMLIDVSKNLMAHVALEEKLMKEVKYPALVEHQREHSVLLHTLQDVILLVNTGKPVYWNIVTRLHDIFINHIGKYDDQFAEYMQTNKIKIS